MFKKKPKQVAAPEPEPPAMPDVLYVEQIFDHPFHEFDVAASPSFFVCDDAPSTEVARYIFDRKVRVTQTTQVEEL